MQLLAQPFSELFCCNQELRGRWTVHRTAITCTIMDLMILPMCVEDFLVIRSATAGAIARRTWPTGIQTFPGTALLLGAELRSGYDRHMRRDEARTLDL